MRPGATNHGTQIDTNEALGVVGGLVGTSQLQECEKGAPSTVISYGCLRHHQDYQPFLGRLTTLRGPDEELDGRRAQALIA